MSLLSGINGFGRIWSLMLCTQNQFYHRDLQVTAANDLNDVETNAHLFKYDSNYGIYPGDVSATSDVMTIDGNAVKIIAEKDPR